MITWTPLCRTIWQFCCGFYNGATTFAALLDCFFGKTIYMMLSIKQVFIQTRYSLLTKENGPAQLRMPISQRIRIFVSALVLSTCLLFLNPAIIMLSVLFSSVTRSRVSRRFSWPPRRGQISVVSPGHGDTTEIWLI